MTWRLYEFQPHLCVRVIGTRDEVKTPLFLSFGKNPSEQFDVHLGFKTCVSNFPTKARLCQSLLGKLP